MTVVTTVITTGSHEVEYVAPWEQALYSSPTGLIMRLDDPAIELVSDHEVALDPAQMRIDQPYGYRLGGVECVAVRREDGRIEFFELPTR